AGGLEVVLVVRIGGVTGLVVGLRLPGLGLFVALGRGGRLALLIARTAGLGLRLVARLRAVLGLIGVVVVVTADQSDHGVQPLDLLLDLFALDGQMLQRHPGGLILALSGGGAGNDPSAARVGHRDALGAVGQVHALTSSRSEERRVGRGGRYA